MNKYEKWYASIIENARLNTYAIGKERHHVIPKSMGGNNESNNLVYITAREHFVCHWLLTKIYSTGEEHWKMLNALRMMRAENPNQTRYNTKITSRVYANLKEEYSRLQSERIKGANNPNFGKTWSQEQKDTHSKKISGRIQPLAEKEKQVKSMIGRKRAAFSDEWKTKMSDAKKGENNTRYGIEVSDETRKKIGDKLRGRKQTDEEKTRRSVANIGKVKPKQLCPHCNQMIAVNVYPRWHGDNCKKKL